jgi:hypothetical protein
MNLLPLRQKERMILNNSAPDRIRFSKRKTVIFAERYMIWHHIQFKNGMVATAQNVYVRGLVIVQVYNYPQCANPYYGWHNEVILS